MRKSQTQRILWGRVLLLAFFAAIGLAFAGGSISLQPTGVRAAPSGVQAKASRKAIINVASLPVSKPPAQPQKPKHRHGEDDDIPPVAPNPQVPVGSTGARSAASSHAFAGPASPLPAALSGNSGGGQEELEQFDSLSFDNFTPPDNGFSVGPNHIVQFDNVAGAIYDRTPAHNATSVNLVTFFGAPINTSKISQPAYSDPRVLYHKQSGRWYAAILIFDGCGGKTTCANVNNSEIDIAVSQTSDPTGNWAVYTVGTNYSNQLLDQPKLGVSNDKAVMTWNITGFAGPYQFIEVQKSDLDALANSVALFTFTTDGSHYNVIPVVTLGSINTEYAASINRGGSTMTVFEFTGTPLNSPGYTTHDISVGTVNDPPLADQLGDTRQLDTGTAGEQTAVWQNGILYAAGNTKCKPPNDATDRSCLSFHIVNTGNFSLVQDAVVGQTNAHLFYPAVMPDSAGNLWVGHSVSSSTQYATAGDTYFAGHNIQSSNPGIDFKTGVGPYNCTFCFDTANPPNPTRNRWGDYSGSAQDPNNPKDVWLSVEFGTFDNNTDDWRLEIARFTASAPVVSSLSPTHTPEQSTTCAPSVTILGTDFQLGATVKFGAATASATVVSPEEITSIAPAQAAQTVDVTVTTPLGTSATSGATKFTYDPDTIPPKTMVVPGPAPNGFGWNRTSVNLSFSASDLPAPCGSGVKDITVSASGATIYGPVTTPGSSASLLVTAEGVTTVSYYATDNAGNVETTNTLVVRIDETNPVVSCGSPDGLWHATDVTIGCTASDALSGLANPADASFGLSTSVLAGTETANAFTGTRTVQDKAGNSTTAGPIGPNKIDKKPPDVTVTTPADGATYVINQPVAASFACVDGGSGVATCTGTIANGANIDTASVGTKTFTVNATDNVGNSSSKTVTYKVTYNICLLYDPTQPVARQSLAPIKLEICDFNNVNLSSNSVTVHADDVLPAVSGAPSSNSNPGNNFRFDLATAPGGGYIYNLIVKTFPPGPYSLIVSVAGDPLTHVAPFTVK